MNQNKNNGKQMQWSSFTIYGVFCVVENVELGPVF